MFRKMPFILVAIILSIMLFGDLIPVSFQAYLYGFSLSIKSLIIFVLPFVVFSLLFKSTLYFANQASKMVLFILFMIMASNFTSTLLSYTVGSFAYQFDLSIPFPDEKSALMPYGVITVPALISNGWAMLFGLTLGLFSGRFIPEQASKIAAKFDQMTKVILRLILIVIPFFLAGFIIKMHHDRVIGYIWSHYTFMFSLTLAAVFSYITFFYACINRFQIKKTWESIKNIFPAAIAGFSSMSSAAAMPLTILGAEKNAKNPSFAKSVIPMTVNVHLIGDCFAIPIFAFVVLKSFGIGEPSLVNYLIFAGYFVMAKFSVAAVPGGGILVMLPILEQYLGFNGEMLSLITALYILFDPVITSANVLGNGGFAMGIEKLSNKLLQEKKLG